jgi:hypothetical protein
LREIASSRALARSADRWRARTDPGISARLRLFPQSTHSRLADQGGLDFARGRVCARIPATPNIVASFPEGVSVMIILPPIARGRGRLLVRACSLILGTCMFADTGNYWLTDLIEPAA